MRCAAAFLAAATAAAAVLGGAAMAEDTKGFAAGAEAPEIRLNDHTGKAVRIADLRGKSRVVLAFFPKAMTPG